MKNRLRRLLSVLFIWGHLSTGFATPFTFQFLLLPISGSIEGDVGTLIGWGYQITNEDPANWFVTTALSASSIAIGTPDASYFDFPIVAPGDTATAAFDAIAGTGLYGLALSPFAVSGQSDAGIFALSGEWWSGDPFGSGVFVREAPAIQASFLATVTGDGDPGVVPEPGAILLVLTGFGLQLLARKRSGKKIG